MPIIPNTYDGLVSAVKALAEDDSSEFSTYIPVAIHLAEERLLKELDTLGTTKVSSLTATASSNSLTKPSGHRFTRDLRVTTSTGSITILEKKTNDYLRDYWPTVTSVGTPKYYADDNNTTFILAPTPASAYTITCQYIGQETHLSASNQTNYYTDFCSDSLFYATMSHMSEFMHDYSIVQIWEAKLQASLTGTNNEGRRNRRDDSTGTPKNPSENTLNGNV